MDQGDCSVIKNEEHVVEEYVLPMLKVRLKSILFEYWIQRLVTISILLSLCRVLPHSCEQATQCIIVMNCINILHSFCACVHAREFVNACDQ